MDIYGQSSIFSVQLWNMFHRIINLSKSNSFFLFGARGVGKTSLLKSNYSSTEAFYIDLLSPNNFERFFRNPEELNNILKALSDSTKWVIIDEIQKVPQLLDIVHQQIESSPRKFILTGSSSRKLKRGGANLLAGRAFIYELYPLTHIELGTSFNLDKILQWGSLPKIWNVELSDSDKELYLKAYSQTYLKEEIQEEQLIRNLKSFYTFLEIAAQMNGKILNYSKISNDVGVDTKTVQKYFDIIDETHIGFRLPSYHQSLRKRQRENPKFYFFDIGVQRSLLKVAKFPVTPGTFEYGNLFEHFIILELLRLNSYLNQDYNFSYFQTHHNLEVDLVIDRPRKKTIFCEIKSKNQISESDLNSLRSIKKDFPEYEFLCISQDSFEKNIDGVHCLPWTKGITHILGEQVTKRALTKGE